MAHHQYRAALVEHGNVDHCHRCRHLENQLEQLREDLEKATRRCQYLEREVVVLRVNPHVEDDRSWSRLTDNWSEWADDKKFDHSNRARAKSWNEPSWEDVAAPRHLTSKRDDDLSEPDAERKDRFDKIMALRRNIENDNRHVTSPKQDAPASQHAATSYQHKTLSVKEKSRQSADKNRPPTQRSLEHEDPHNVALLTDTYRPERVAEMYSEIYDNHWAEAFQIVKEHKPKELDAITALMKVLQASYDMCAEISEEQLKTIEEASHFPRSKWTTLEMKNLYLKQVSTPAPITRTTCAYLRAIAKFCIPYIQHTFRVKKLPSLTEMRVQGKKIEGEALTEFVNKCVEVTWYMNIQDPPMAFHISGNRGSVLDKNYFRFYSLRGTTLDYIVWPALLLHDDGEVAMKGVAQPLQSA